MSRSNAHVENENEEVIYLGTEQPEACRWCGGRTDFDVISTGLQAHQCLSCAKQYLVEFED
jgi:hypothetical protein